MDTSSRKYLISGSSIHYLFLGKKNNAELVRIYKSADVFVLSSRSEGQPLTILEAMAARLPVIATDVGDNRLLVKNGMNGYLVSPENINKLALIMEKIISMPHRKLGFRGYTLVKKKYSWDNTAKIYHKLFLSLTNAARINIL